MKNKFYIIALLGILSTGNFISAEEKILKAVDFTRVTINDSFWLPRLKTNSEVTIPFAFRKCAETGRISNFAKAGGLQKGKFIGRRYNDSDVYKVMEGAAYSLSLFPDKKLENFLNKLIEKIALAQEKDGYLYTTRTIDPQNPAAGAGKKRWSNLGSSHELYNVGHMYEAAVAYYLATGNKNFLNIAKKNADLIVNTFGPGKKRGFSGHQEIEIGLVKLYKVTKNKKYLNLARFFLDERGKKIHEKKFPEDSDFSIYNQAWYLQAHKPVIRQREAVGHAVRATYMYAGMADVAALTNNRAYIKSINRIWKNVVNKKMYITGGIGSRHQGEAFGNNYELPNATGYNETCAAIGNIFFNYRLFLLNRDAKYIDVLERVLYNGFLSGISLSGDRFFYPNPLESDGKYKFNQGESTRKPWFDCACCPVNIARFIPSIQGYVYAKTNRDIFINLYINSKGTIKLKNNIVELSQRTGYPWKGKIQIKVTPQKAADFTICLRIPGWAKNSPVPGNLYSFLNKNEEKFALQVNAQPVKYREKNGYAVIEKFWQRGDLIELNLPLPVRRIITHQKVRENLNKVALQRGPLVYCFEGIDNNKKVLDKVIPDKLGWEVEFKSNLLKGINILKSKNNQGDQLIAVPYYAWSHRGAGEMAVWMLRDRKIKQGEKKLNIKKDLFGKTGKGQNVYIYTLKNSNQLEIKIIQYGGIITSINIPAKNKPVDIVLGFDNLEQYLKGHPYFGALIGRYGNRIAKGRFKLAGQEYRLAANNGSNHLHGGIKGFDKVIWECEEINGKDEVGLKLKYLSRDGEEGYPGNLKVAVTYTLNDKNELKITYDAVTDKATPLNLTHHSYFNLNGEGADNILNHQLTLNAQYFTPVDKELIPTGELKEVKGTPMDFLDFLPIGSRIDKVSGGYDHNYVIDGSKMRLAMAAKVTSPKTGISMEVYTTEPGIQFYTGNFLDGTLQGKSGKKYPKHQGFCLETQHYPDSPNQPKFPSTILKPGEKYHTETIYKFVWEKK